MTGPRFAFFLCLGVAVTGELKENFLGDSFEFLETKHCRKHGANLEHLSTDRPRLVARFDGEFWKPGPGYEGRMSPNTSAVLHSTNINDNGLYALTCGEGETRTQLDILVASELSATEGESAHLTFHHITTEAHGRYIRCKRNGKLMFELDIVSGKIGKVTEPEERVSVSPDWRLTGNVSVFFNWVKTEDQGDYILYGLHEKESKRTWGHPAAVRMKVNKKKQNQTTFTPAPTQRDTELKTGTWTTVGIATAVTLTVAFSAAGFGLGWWLKSCSSTGPPIHAPDEGTQYIRGRLATIELDYHHNDNGAPAVETAV